MDIWHTARPDANGDQGWLGAFMSEVYKVGESPFQCVNIGNSIPKALLTPNAPAAAVQDANTFQFLADRRCQRCKDPLLKTFGQVYAKPGKKLPTMDLVAQGWDTTARGVEALAASTEKYQAERAVPAVPVRQVAAERGPDDRGRTWGRESSTSRLVASTPTRTRSRPTPR